jgi:hypothetical protein
MPSKLLNPFGEDGGAWDSLVFGGVRFEGIVTITGTPWKKKHDHRRARGRNGARSVATGWDLGEWSLSLVAIEDKDIDALGELIDAVTRRDAQQDAAALAIEHPAIAVAGVTQVLLEEADTPEVDPKGKVTWTCKVREYRPPAARDVTRTPAPADQATERYGTEVLEASSYRNRLPTPPSSDP